MRVSEQAISQLVDGCRFDDPPDSWRIEAGEDGPVIRGRWTEAADDSKPIKPWYYHATLTGSVGQEIEEMFNKVTASITFDVDQCPAKNKYNEIIVDTHGPTLVPADDSTGFVGILEYLTETKRTQEAAFEEIEGFFHGFVGSPDRFEEGEAPSEIGTVTITYDGLSTLNLIWEPPVRRFVFPQPELTDDINRLTENALLNHVAGVTVELDHWIEGQSFAYFVDDSREYQKAREQANFTVNCRL